MPDYKNVVCPICKELLKDGDDIVVCPYCGAPYHRKCLKSTDLCVFKDKHGENFVWENPNSKKEDSKSEEEPKVQFNVDNSKPFFDNTAFFLRFNLIDANSDEELNGIKIKEYSEFIQQSTRYYIPEFKKINAKKRSSFNFSAAFFTGMWLIFRKCYVLGSIICIFLLSDLVLQIFANQQIFVPMLDNFRVESVVDLFNNYDVESITNYMFKLPTQKIILFISSVFITIVRWAIMLFMGIRGNKLYMNHCIRSINKIKSQNLTTKSYSQSIHNTGGVNFPLVFMLIVICAVLAFK